MGNGDVVVVVATSHHEKKKMAIRSLLGKFGCWMYAV
jgi:hypothetical protein